MAMLCYASFKIIDSQSSASDSIPLCFSTASKIKNIKCPAVNQKWWDRLINIYPEKDSKVLKHWCSSLTSIRKLNSWLLEENRFKYFFILLIVWSRCILVYKIKNCFYHPSRKILVVFDTSCFIITEFPEYFFFLILFIIFYF